MNYTGLVILIILNIPIYFFFGRVLFKTWDDFGEAVSYLVTPRIISALQGEFWNRWWVMAKFTLWLGLCFVTVYLEYVKIGQITDWW